jgi:hypothetical protein
MKNIESILDKLIKEELGINSNQETSIIKEYSDLKILDIEHLLVESIFNELVSRQTIISERKKKKGPRKHMPGYKADAKKNPKRHSDLNAAQDTYKAAMKAKREGDHAKAKRLKKKAQQMRDRQESSHREKLGDKFNPPQSKWNSPKKRKKSKKNETVRLSHQQLDFLLERKFSKKIKKSLQKKAEKHNIPYSVAKGVFIKGLGAYTSSGSRPGMSAVQWAHARLNSFLRGGPARKVDSKYWERVKAYRKKNKGKRKASKTKRKTRRSKRR